jgi:fructokinase
MRVGVDLGGTKIEAIVIDDEGLEQARKRVPTPKDDYRGIVQAIANLAGDVEKEAGERGSVGIGIPGAMSLATGLVKNANTTCLIGEPLDRDLEAALNRPVRIMNDANCFALSEAVDGAGAGAKVVFGVIVGTGCGGGTVIDGQALVGVNAIAGEWGHNPLPWPNDTERPGAACFCGQSGCIETFLSGPGLARDHFDHTGERLAPEKIAGRAKGDGTDPAADATFRRYEDRMARALATILNVLDPDVVVLGGGLSNIDRLYRNVPQLWGAYTYSDEVTTRLEKAVHGDSSGVRGAAWLWRAGETDYDSG